MQNLAARVGSAAEIRFDQASRTSHSDQPVPLGGVPRAMREAAEMAGLDPLAELYTRPSAMRPRATCASRASACRCCCAWRPTTPRPA